MSSHDPQTSGEVRAAARYLLVTPLMCAEHDPDQYALVRRHAATLDRWFTQRLGYRLHVGADTARLFKTGYVPDDRPLRTRTQRPLHQLEYVILALALSATAAGPAVISLRDLVADIRSAAAEAEIALPGDTSERRALVSALRWMIDHGLARELYEHVGTYATDADADALLQLRPDRIVLVAANPLAGAADRDELLERAERRGATRVWMRCRLVEDPVVYRDDLDDNEWAELRRRLGEEAAFLSEMFGLELEARLEGIAAIDVDGSLSDESFPSGGTVGHAALLLVERLAATAPEPTARGHVVEIVRALVDAHRSRWAADLAASPERLARQALALLSHVRLVSCEGDEVRMLPAGARFMLATSQASLW